MIPRRRSSAAAAGAPLTGTHLHIDIQCSKAARVTKLSDKPRIDFVKRYLRLKIDAHIFSRTDEKNMHSENC